MTARPGRPAAAACSVGRSGWPGGFSGARWPAGGRRFAFGAAAAGAAAKGIGSLLGGSTQLKHVFTSMGGQTALTNAYLAAIMSMAGLAAAAYAVAAVSRLRAEETAAARRAGAGHRDRPDPLGAQPWHDRGGRFRRPARRGGPGRRARLRAAGWQRRDGGRRSAGRGAGPMAGVARGGAGAIVVLFGAVPRATVAGGWTWCRRSCWWRSSARCCACPGGCWTSRRSPTCRSFRGPGARRAAVVAHPGRGAADRRGPGRPAQARYRLSALRATVRR